MCKGRLEKMRSEKPLCSKWTFSSAHKFPSIWLSLRSFFLCFCCWLFQARQEVKLRQRTKLNLFLFFLLFSFVSWNCNRLPSNINLSSSSSSSSFIWKRKKSFSFFYAFQDHPPFETWSRTPLWKKWGWRVGCGGGNLFNYAHYFSHNSLRQQCRRGSLWKKLKLSSL